MLFRNVQLKLSLEILVSFSRGYITLECALVILLEAIMEAVFKNHCAKGKH